MKKLQCRHDRFPIFAAPPISDRSRELTRKTGGLKHTPAVGLDATSTTKIFQLFFFVVHFIYALFTRRHRVPRAHVNGNKFNAVLCTLIYFMNAE